MMHRVATVAAFGLLAAVLTVTSAVPALAAGHRPTSTTTTVVHPTARAWARTDRAAVARLATRSLAAPHAAAKGRPASADPTVIISSHCAAFCFVPDQLTVAVGDTVSWVNASGAEHTVTRCTPSACTGASGGTGTDASFGSADVAAASGTTFSHVFTEPGTYVYYCKIHGYALMHGTITVTAAPTTTTSAPASSMTPSTAVPTTATTRQLASTGGDTGGVTMFAVLLIACGIGASALGLRRRDV